MIIVDKEISVEELKKLSEEYFGDFIKAVVDINRKIMAINAELHADEEQILLNDGSRQEDLWGINIYPEKTGDDFIEFDSMINIRPRQNNRSRGVENPEIRDKINEVVRKMIKE